MVSTRGVRYKFSEGERVLCYEPDPTKAKVLYDSKVLEVIENKDKRGRRTVEYLIHFQGWNSSWDRCVSEDFVLKDTAENRQLQRELAEKSQLQLGAYLYRRERKKGGSASSTGLAAKRARLGLSDDGSSSSTQPEGEGVEGGCEDTDSSLGSGSHSSSQPRSPPAHHGRANIPLPNALRDRLTFDYHLVVKRGRLSCLPASPCAAEILESFVKWFARAGAWHPPRSRHDPPQKPDLIEVSCKLNLVREIADGLRVYFDFILRSHLLYKQEHRQYHTLCGLYTDRPEEIETEPTLDNIKTEKEKDLTDIKKEGTVKKEPLITSFKNEVDEQETSLAMVEQDIKSPKLPEYSHLPPDPEDIIKNEVLEPTIFLDAPVKTESTDKHTSITTKSECTAEDKPNSPGQQKHKDIRPSTRSGNLARRLRSYKSTVSPCESEGPAPSTSAVETKPCETQSSSVGSSGSSLTSQSEWTRPPPAATPAPATHTRTPLSQLLDGVAKWEILPREGTEHLPSRVYGAIHLARLFVKLPDFLNATQMQDLKLKMLLKHIDKFVQYLEEHSEWFGESHYILNSITSRSH